ncbi:MAG: S8 family serine peptidase [Gammaproteobacteria bacterium]|nr:S8 family serine peptidase [Gammaproteobacteria bacterium]
MRNIHVMRKLVLISAIVGLFFGAAATAVSVQFPVRQVKSLPAPSYVVDELLVKFKPHVAGRFKAQAIETHGDRHIRELTPNGYVHVKLKPGTGVTRGMTLYKADSNIESVQPNYIYHATAVPNDIDYGQMWGLKNTGQMISAASYPTNNPGVAGQDMDMEAAWDHVKDCNSRVVAVLDSGVNYTHQDLAANMWDGTAAGFPNHGFDFLDNDNDPMPQDAYGHGTHVAGTIGAVGNNNLGTTGVCWQAKIMALRVLSASGGTTAAITQGVNFAVAHGAKVINMSLSGSTFDPAFNTEITNARNNGVIVIVAAGNEANNNDVASTVYPCNFSQDNLICVAALDQAYALATFSNFGATSVDVGAPGVNAKSAWPGPTISDDFTSGWTLTGAFTAVSCDLDGPGPVAPFRMLVNPANWCAFGSYANNANDVAYKTFDLSSFLHARLGFLFFLDTQLNTDFAGTAYKSSGGDPFSGMNITEVSGTTNNFAVEGSADLNNCRTATCSVGFRLRSDAAIIDFGLGILDFQIDTVEMNSNVYQVLNGTSMASPHVAGLAALIWSYNPSYTYPDVVNSVKNGGEPIAALSGITTTGRAVNAMGSLRYINPPSGVAAVIQ